MLNRPIDAWFSAAACLLALIAAGFALWAASVEAPTIRDSLDHFIGDLTRAAEVRRVQGVLNMIAAGAAMLAAICNVAALALRVRSHA